MQIGMDTLANSNSKDEDDNIEITLVILTPSRENGLLKFDSSLHHCHPIVFNSWLKKLVDDWISPVVSGSTEADSNQSRPQPSLLMDYIFQLIGTRASSWKRYLWAYALFLNRTNTHINDPLFIRIKSMFTTVLLYLQSTKILPQDLAELEVIRNHLRLNLDLKGSNSDPTLTSIGSSLESAYTEMYEKRYTTPPHSWSSVLEEVTSRTKFEHIYPPEEKQDHDDGSTNRGVALFLENGKSDSIQPLIPGKRPHPEDNVIEIRDESDVREAFKMFMEQFLLNLESPDMTPGLMRSMILLIIDIMDVALLYKLSTIGTMFGDVGLGKNIKEPNILGKGLFKLWVWTGIMCNPSHRPRNHGLSTILKLRSKVKRLVTAARFCQFPENLKDQVLEYMTLNRRITKIKLNRDGLDFHSFIRLLGKYYPRRSRKEGRLAPGNELEEMYLNIRLDFGFPPTFFFNSHFAAQRLCATSTRYCSFRLANGKMKDTCSICDSSSEDED